MADYIILRHGETEGNVKGIHQCRIDTPLTAKGKKQMVAMGKKVAQLQKQDKIPPVDEIYCSPMGRTNDSLDIFMEYSGINAQIEHSKLLLEHNMGEYDGLTELEVEKIDSGFTKQRASNRWLVSAPGGENYYNVQKRVIDFLLDIKDKKGTILVMGHKATNKILVATIMGLSRGALYRIPMPLGGGHYLNQMGIIYRDYNLITSELSDQL